MERSIPEAMLVILGAGASSDCLPPSVAGYGIATSASLPSRAVEDARPPMTQQLAESRALSNWVLGHWRSATPVVAHLRDTLSRDEGQSEEKVKTLEVALREFEAAGDRIPERKRQMLAMRFYLRDLFAACTDYMCSPELAGGVTNHVALLNRLLEWCSPGNRTVVFISFNYDFILERAMEALWGFRPLDLNNYLAHDRVQLLKPHGSVLWNWRVDHPSQAFRGGGWIQFGEASIDEALRNSVDETDIQCQAFPQIEGLQVPLPIPSMIPALALPTDDKSFVWPQSQEDHLKSLQGTVTRVLTIGWRGLEPHFLPLLRPLVKHYARVLTVSGGAQADAESASTKARLLDAFDQVPPDSVMRYTGGFARLIEDRPKELEWVLSMDSDWTWH